MLNWITFVAYKNKQIKTNVMKTEVKRISSMLISLSKMEMEAEIVIKVKTKTSIEFESILHQVDELLKNTPILYGRIDNFADIDRKSESRKKIIYTY